MERTNKTIKVKQHLNNVGHITSMEAIDLYGATRLSSIIFNLRKRGMNIETIPCVTIDRYGNRCEFAEYRYDGE